MIQNADGAAEKTPRKMKRSYKVAGVLLGIIVIYLLLGVLFWKIGMPAFMFKYEKNDKGGITITDYRGTYLHVHIPDKINGFEVTEIGEFAFSDYEAKDFPDNSTNFKAHCRFTIKKNIREVIIPDTVEKIYGDAFFKCFKLEKVNIPSSLREIGYGHIFAYTKIKEIELPEGMTKINNCAFFYSSSLEKVTLPDSIEEISDGAFKYCPNLKEINVPAGLKKIDLGVFEDTALTDEQIQAFCDKAEDVLH